MLTLGIFGAVGAIGAIGFVLARGHRLRQLAAANHEVAGARFASHFDTGDTSVALLASTHAVLGERRSGRSVDVRPEAVLARDFQLARLDLEDVALVIVTRAGGRVPGAEDLDRLSESVVTVEDLVHFLAPFCRPPSPELR